MKESHAQIPLGKNIILYDGVCDLCNRLNRFVLPKDSKNAFLFASLQSSFARDILIRYGRNPEDLDSFYIIVDYGLPSEHLLSRAQAALFVLNCIGGIYKLAGIMKVLPKGVLDWGYNFVAANRYRWFGRYDTCLMPEPKYREKFIEI